MNVKSCCSRHTRRTSQWASAEVLYPRWCKRSCRRRIEVSSSESILLVFCSKTKYMRWETLYHRGDNTRVAQYVGSSSETRNHPSPIKFRYISLISDCLVKTSWIRNCLNKGIERFFIGILDILLPCNAQITSELFYWLRISS